MRRSVVKSYFAALLFTAFADPVAATRKKPWKEKIYMPKCAVSNQYESLTYPIRCHAARVVCMRSVRTVCCSVCGVGANVTPA